MRRSFYSKCCDLNQHITLNRKDEMNILTYYYWLFRVKHANKLLKAKKARLIKDINTAIAYRAYVDETTQITNKMQRIEEK